MNAGDPTTVNKRITGMNLAVCQNKTTGYNRCTTHREFTDTT